MSHAEKLDVEQWAAQHHNMLAREEVARDALITELHRCKTMQGIKRSAAINFTKS
jgi:hypothetical protein